VLESHFVCDLDVLRLLVTDKAQFQNAQLPSIFEQSSLEKDHLALPSGRSRKSSAPAFTTGGRDGVGVSQRWGIRHLTPPQTLSPVKALRLKLFCSE
jgi:hypothetical protein